MLDDPGSVFYFFKYLIVWNDIYYFCVDIFRHFISKSSAGHYKDFYGAYLYIHFIQASPVPADLCSERTLVFGYYWLLLATGVDDNICLLSDSQDIMLGTESRHNIN